MIKKALAAIALAGTLTLLAASPSFATETYVRQPVGTVTTTDQATAVKQAFSDIQQRLSADPVLLRQVQRAASVGDSVVASQLLTNSLTDVVAVGSADTVQTESLRVQVKVTVCVRVWGTVYCGTVTVTVDL